MFFSSEKNRMKKDIDLYLKNVYIRNLAIICENDRRKKTSQQSMGMHKNRSSAEKSMRINILPLKLNLLFDDGGCSW